MDGDIDRIYRILDDMSKTRDRDKDSLNAVLGKVERALTTLTLKMDERDKEFNYIRKKIDYVRKTSSTIKSDDVVRMIDDRLDRHNEQCTASSVYSLKERGLIEDTRAFASKHPFGFSGGLGITIFAIFNLILELITMINGG